MVIEKRREENQCRCGDADVGAYVCNSLITGSNPICASYKKPENFYSQAFCYAHEHPEEDGSSLPDYHISRRWQIVRFGV